MTRPLATTAFLLLAAALTATTAPAVLAQDAVQDAAQDAAKSAAKTASPFPVAALANTGWALEFTPKTPKAVAVKLANGETKWYWYMPFHLENREDETRWFIPSIEVVTDTGRIHNCNNPVPAEVYDTIYKRCGNALSEPLLRIAGPMKPGKDFAHDSLAIWPADTGDVDSFTVYVGGIYGETQPVNDPSTGKPLMVEAKDPITGETRKDADGNPVMQPAELKRTLRLTYATPGTGNSLTHADVALKSSEDVMR